MQQFRLNGEVILEIYRNVLLAIMSISNILPDAVNGDIREEIMREHEEYEKICSETSALALKYGVDLKEPNAIKKAVLWSTIKMGTASDNSPQNIAQIMVKGTLNGITTLKTLHTDNAKILAPEVKKLLVTLITLEESFEKKLKTFL